MLQERFLKSCAYFSMWHGLNIAVRHNLVAWDFGDDGVVTVAQSNAGPLIIAFEAVTELQALHASQASRAAYTSVLERLHSNGVEFSWLEPRPMGVFSRLLKPDRVWGYMRALGGPTTSTGDVTPFVYLGLSTSWSGVEQRISFGAKRPINAFDGQKYRGQRQAEFIERSVAALRQAQKA